MKKIYILSAFFAILFLSSCGGESHGSYLGKSVYYEKFLWSVFPEDEFQLPVQTLQMRLGDIKFREPIKLQVVYQDENGKMQPVNSYKCRMMDVFVDGEKINGCEITILPTQKDLDLQFRFNHAGQADGTYNLSLMIVDPGDLDVVNGKEAKKGVSVLDWQAKYEVVTNPLKVFVIWMVILIVALIVLWFALLRHLIFPTFDFDNLQVIYLDGESKKGREDCSLRGARKIICCESPNYQSGFNRLMCGRVEYLTNPFWTSPVELTPNGSDGIAVNEDIKAGDPSTYRMTAMITAQNGPKRPFVVKRVKSDLMAHISIG